MTPDIALVLFILGAAIVLFATERVRVDVVSMMVLLTLLFTGLVTTEEAFSGFSSPAVVTVWAIYIVSAGLMFTGVADFLGQSILRVSGTEEWRLILVIMLTVGTMSAFMNNIGATAVLLPAVVAIGVRAGIPSSKLLDPTGLRLPARRGDYADRHTAQPAGEQRPGGCRLRALRPV